MIKDLIQYIFFCFNKNKIEYFLEKYKYELDKHYNYVLENNDYYRAIDAFLFYLMNIYHKALIYAERYNDERLLHICAGYIYQIRKDTCLKINLETEDLFILKSIGFIK